MPVAGADYAIRFAKLLLISVQPSLQWHDGSAPTSIESLLSCRLIALYKNPGIRPIGVCEVARRIIGKVILLVTSLHIQRAAGPLQLCTGQEAGIEAAVHTIQSLIEQDETESVLLVDAQNAFNSLNRQIGLINNRMVCLILSKILVNTYRSPTHLCVGGETLLSCEGVTQGDPLAMAMYALASIPLIRRIRTDHARQVWFTADATAGGKLTATKDW